MIPGDLHLTEPGRENHRVAEWVVAQANDLIRPDFVQFIGDNVQDAAEGQFRLFRELADALRVPWFALVGDHDVHGDPAAAGFRRHVGEPTGSLRLGGFRFVRLNTQEARPVGLSAGQVEWLRAEADAAAAAGERVVLFQHNYPYQIWEDFAGPGVDGWREIVQTRRIHAVLAGHTHYWQVANDGRNAAVATRSIGDPEGGPPGYALAHVRSEEFAVTYRTVEDAGPVVLITWPRDVLLATGPDHVVRALARPRARVWSASSPVSVEGRIDGGAWFPLEPADGNEWAAAAPPGERLTKGTHELVVRARDASERDGRQRITFAVDPTGRYTAVPGVRPVVTATQFC
jgi:hypothetical protein